MSTLFISQGCGSSSKMTLVGTALNFGVENGTLSSSADVLLTTSNLAISRCCFADDGKEVDKSEKRTYRACKAIGCLPFTSRNRLVLNCSNGKQKLPNGKFSWDRPVPLTQFV